MEVRRHQSEQCPYGLAVTTILINICWGGDVLHYGSGLLLFSGTPLKDKGFAIRLQDLFLHLPLTCNMSFGMTLTENVICASAKSGIITALAGSPQAKLIHTLKIPVLNYTQETPFLVLLRT